MTFLDYYRENLAHIRGTAAEFAAEFPKIASRLELSAYNCQDPYVERLLEGAAFLAARVENKLEKGFPRFLETVASSSAPFAVSPIPSYAVIGFEPDYGDERLRTGYQMRRGAQFKCKVPGVDTPCVFSTVCDASIGAAVLRSVQYRVRDLDSYGISDREAAAALVLGVVDADGVGGATMADDLLCYLDMPDGSASALQGQLCGDLRGVYMRQGNETRRLDDVTVDVPMFASSEEDGRIRVLDGFTTMLWFMAQPRFFKFFRVTGLKRCFDAAKGLPLELIFSFGRREESFVRSVGSNSIRLNCVPVANVFSRWSDRTECNGAFEHHISPCRSAPQDFEVLRVDEVEAYDAQNRVLFKAVETYQGDAGDRFVPHRRERLFKPMHARSSYHGSDVFVSLAGEGYDAHHDEIRQIGARIVCTNRDLPLLIRVEDPVVPSSEEPIMSAAFVGQPSPPFLPLICGGNAGDWERIGLIALNLSSVLWRDGALPVEVLRRLVRTFVFDEEGVARRLAEAIADLRSEPKTFRFVSGGTPYFESGWRIELLLKEDLCSGTGVFIFSRVLRELLLSYVPINSCVEFVVSTDRRKEAFRWRT